ncbi:PREDICTED: uncharacterized protein LOC109224291 [Nicotiana attenuata]|uniref:uncharacterized protein LOC109224291 n=1 Tax=Nicotiana attenuata TaxID=49451 RepID=UPI000905085C|nr:PREDICTED: uncharacterized protein LOC109224291 [Nicotiana attenuata]
MVVEYEGGGGDMVVVDNAERRAPFPVVDIEDWVAHMLPYMVGIRDWAIFVKRFGLKVLSVIGLRISKKKAPILAFRQAIASAGMQFTIGASSPRAEEVCEGGGPVRSVEGDTSSAVGGYGAAHAEDDGSGSDIDPEDVRAFLERHTCVEVRTEGPNRHVIIPADYDLLVNSEQVVSAFAPLCAASENTALQAVSDAELSRSISGMALRTLIMEIENDRRDERRTAVFGKLASKYKEYHTKNRALADVFTQDSNFQLFRDGLKQKEEELAQKVNELKERDDELTRAIGRCSKLEAALKAKDDELEVSKGITAENADLQARVAALTAELGRREAEAVDLRGELSTKADDLARAEKGRITVVSEVATVEGALRVSRSKRDNKLETPALKVARLEKQIQDLEAELSVSNDQAAALKIEEANGKVFEAELEGIRVKARAAHEACGYDPGTPVRDDVDDNDADRLASDSWYNEEYAAGDDVA